jgi:hypothetical protein
MWMEDDTELEEEFEDYIIQDMAEESKEQASDT